MPKASEGNPFSSLRLLFSEDLPRPSSLELKRYSDFILRSSNHLAGVFYCHSLKQTGLTLDTDCRRHLKQKRDLPAMPSTHAAQPAEREMVVSRTIIGISKSIRINCQHGLLSRGCHMAERSVVEENTACVYSAEL